MTLGVRVVTSVYWGGGVRSLPSEAFVCGFFLLLVAVVDQIVLVPVGRPAKCIVLPFLPCEMATFQR